jgi:hypothetical protein
LLPTTSRSGKRGGVIALVKKALSAAGHADPKSVGKKLNALYGDRNSLIHEGKPVSDSDLAELRKIVRSTLKAKC